MYLPRVTTGGEEGKRRGTTGGEEGHAACHHGR